jgi:hypothetical protein
MALSPAMLARFKQQAALYLASGHLGRRVPNEATALLLMAKAYEIGMQPLEGLSQLYCVNGIVAIQGQGMLSLIRKSGKVRVECIESNEHRAVVRMTRLDTGDVFTADWSMERAVAAGITQDKGQTKPVWTRFATEMLRWKAVAEAARFIAPDVIAGVYAVEEFNVASPDDLTPEVVSMHVEGSNAIGQEGADRINARMKAVVGDDAALRAQIVADARTIMDGFGAKALGDLPPAGEAALLRLFDKYEDPQNDPPDDASDSAAPTAAKLFPDGGMTPVTRWREVCDEHGLGFEEQKALQERAFGAVRPPESPEDMSALVAATLEEMA